MTQLPPSTDPPPVEAADRPEAGPPYAMLAAGEPLPPEPQRGAASTALLTLVEYLSRFFIYVFLPYLPTVVGPAAVLFLMLAVAGGFAGFGIPRLFWHEDLRPQMVTGVAVGCVLLLTAFFAFVRDAHRSARPHWCWRRGLPASAATSSRRLFCVFLGAMTACWVFTGTLVLVAVILGRFASRQTHFTGMVAAICLTLAAGVALLWARLGLGRLSPAYRASVALLTAAPRWAFGVGLALGLVLTVFWSLVIGFVLITTVYTLWQARRASTDPERSEFLLAGTAVLVCGLAFALLSLAPQLPVVAICSLLVILVALHTFTLMMRRRWKLATTVVMLLLVVVAGTSRFKFRVADLDDFYPDSRAGTRPAAAAGDAAALLDRQAIRWREALVGAKGNEGVPAGRRPLVIVCASGGGISAAVWTCATLLELERRQPLFPYHVRLVTGASGGMLGAAYYTATLRHPARGGHALPGEHPAALSPRQMLEAIAADSLSPAAHALVFDDLPRFFSPRPLREDRGHALEAAWGKNLGGALDQPLSALAAGEREGWRPSLVFSPVLIEDGRRLLISNLDLAGVATNTAVRPSGAEVELSRDCDELFRVLRGSHRTMRLAAAARMSASFPYVSPTPVLPLGGRRRAGDAGYFDNYGVELAGRWIMDHQDWLRENVSRVLILRIETFPREEDPGDDSTALSRALEDVAGPPDGALNMRTAITRSRNDHALENLTLRYRELGLPQIRSISITCGAQDVPLTWRLSDDERLRIVADLQSERTLRDLDEVERWFAREQQARAEWESDPAVRRIAQTGQLRVGISEGTQMGWFIYRRNGGDLAGFDIMLAQEIAEKLQGTLGLDRPVKLRLVGPLDWGELLDTPRRREVDMVISSVSFSPEREREYGARFSLPYYQTAQEVLVESGGTRSARPADWTERTLVAVQKNTTSERIAARLTAVLARRVKVEILPKDELEDCIEALRNKEVHAIIADGPYLRTYQEDHADEFELAELDYGLISPVEPQLLLGRSFEPDPAKWPERVRVAARDYTAIAAFAESLRQRLQPGVAVELCLCKTTADAARLLREGKADAVIAEKADIESLEAGLRGETKVAPIDRSSLGLKEPAYLYKDYYGVVMAEDCPQLHWAVNSILATLHGGAGASRLKELEERARDERPKITGSAPPSDR